MTLIFFFFVNTKVNRKVLDRKKILTRKLFCFHLNFIAEEKEKALFLLNRTCRSRLEKPENVSNDTNRRLKFSASLSAFLCLRTSTGFRVS